MTVGSEEGRQADIWDANGIVKRVANATQGFANLRAFSTCNADDTAVFENVADGDFYIVTAVAWSPWEDAVEGFFFAQKVSVKGGETKKVVLSGRAKRLNSRPGHRYEDRDKGGY